MESGPGPDPGPKMRSGKLKPYWYYFISFGTHVCSFYTLVDFSSPFMNISHYEKGFALNDRDLLAIAKRIGKLATYCKRLKDEDSGIRVDTELRPTKKSRDQFKMSVTIELPNKTLRAESRKETILDCIERCIEKLEPQVKKYKELHGGGMKRGRGKAA